MVKILDFEESIKLRPNGEVIWIVIKGNWDYSSIGGDVESIAKSGIPLFMITDDQKYSHIYSRNDDGSITEISDVPNFVELVEEPELRKIRSQLDSRGWNFISILRGRMSYDEIGHLYTLAVQISREGLWDEYEKLFEDPTKNNEKEIAAFIRKRFDNIFKDYPFKSGPENILTLPKEDLKAVVLLKDIDFDRYTYEVASYYCTKLLDRYNVYLPEPISRLMSSFVYGKTATVVVDPKYSIITMNKNGRQADIFPGHVLNPIQIVRYLCKDRNQCVNEWYPKDKYDMILVAPPYGARCGDLNVETYRTKTTNAEYVIVENSLRCLKEGGTLIALVSGGFLFRKDNYVRDIIREEYSIKAMIGMEGAIKPASGIRTFLLVIQKKEKGGCLISTSDKTEKEYPKVIEAIKAIMDENEVTVDGFVTIPEDNIGNEWILETLISSSATEEMQSESYVPLDDVCTIIRGEMVSSKEYLDNDSFGGIPYLRIRNVTGNGLDLMDCVRVPAKYARSIPMKGDIVFTVTGTIGKMGLVVDEVFVPSGQVVILRCKEGIDPEKLMKFLSKEEVRAQINGMTSGNVIRHLPRSSLSIIKVDKDAIKE